MEFLLENFSNQRLDCHPAIVLLDEKGQFAVSLLSGHIGGANELAKKIATSDFAGDLVHRTRDTMRRLRLILSISGLPRS